MPALLVKCSDCLWCSDKQSKQILVSFSSSAILTRLQSPCWRRTSKLNLEINSSTWSGSTIIDRRSPSDSHLGDGRSLAAINPWNSHPATASNYYSTLDRVIAKQRNCTHSLGSLVREHWGLENNHENTTMSSPIKFKSFCWPFSKSSKHDLGWVARAPLEANNQDITKSNRRAHQLL